MSQAGCVNIVAKVFFFFIIGLPPLVNPFAFGTYTACEVPNFLWLAFLMAAGSVLEGAGAIYGR